MAMDYIFQLMMDKSFLIERPARVPDGAGGFIKTYTTVATVPGRLDEEGKQETLSAAKDIVYITHRLFVDPTTDIKREDRVTGDGRVLRVVMLATVHENHPLEVLCEEVDP